MRKHNQSIHLESNEHQKAHRARVARKRARRDMLIEIIDAHESSDEPDIEYLREAKVRLRSINHQLKAMGC